MSTKNNRLKYKKIGEKLKKERGLKYFSDIAKKPKPTRKKQLKQTRVSTPFFKEQACSSWYHTREAKDNYGGNCPNCKPPQESCECTPTSAVLGCENHPEVRRVKDTPTEKWDEELDSKFNHFNDMYAGHKHNEKDPDVGKQICNYNCEEMYNLEDVKDFIRHQLEKERVKTLEEVEKTLLEYAQKHGVDNATVKHVIRYGVIMVEDKLAKTK